MRGIRAVVIFELGIVKSGIPLVTKQYYEEYGTKVEQTLRAGFLSGMKIFAGEAFSDEIKSFTLENYKIVLSSRPDYPDIFVYAIGDKKLNLKFAKKALTKVLEEFFAQYKTLEDFTGNLAMFKGFDQKIDEILGDLTKKPDDRFRAVFE
jgi:hypothetical protein